jgi:hypothetical protein
MDVFGIRHANLMSLLQELEGRGVTKRKDQAQALGGLGSSFLSQLKGGKKMGQDVARGIEEAIGREHGWMDQLHTYDTGDVVRHQWHVGDVSLGSHLVRDSRATIRATMRLVYYVRDHAIDPITEDKEWALIDAAYQVASRVGHAAILDGTKMADAAREVAAILRSS